MSNVPKLRFKEFSGEWEKKKLGDITTKIGSGNTPLGGEKVYIEEGVLFIRSQNVINDKLELSDKTFIPSDIHNKMKGSKVFPNDVLLNITGASIGRSCVVPNNIIEANVNQHVCIVRGDNTLNSNFLQTFISSSKGQKLISQGQTGSGREGLNFQSIASFKLDLPDVKEQEKIASFLKSVNTKIEQLTKKETLLQQYKKGVMKKIFNQEIRFKADDGSEFYDWEEKKLGELFIYRNGGSFESDVIEDGQYNLITLNSIDINGELKLEHKRVNINDNSLSKNDLIMVLSDVAHGNFLGLTAIIPEDNVYVLNQRMGALKPKTNNNISFIRFYINFNQKYFKLHGQGSSQQNLSKGDIEKFIVNIPCLSEQTKIANFLSSIDSKIEQVQKQLNSTKEFKKALLQQMFV